MKMTEIKLEKFKMAKGVIKKLKVKCHKLDPETSYLTRYQALHSICELLCQTKGCAKESNYRFGYLGYGKTTVHATEWSHAEQSLQNTEI